MTKVSDVPLGGVARRRHRSKATASGSNSDPLAQNVHVGQPSEDVDRIK